MTKSLIYESTTCFQEHKKLKISCQKKECKYWHEHAESHNCIIISANEGTKTLQEIGDMFGVTRMRICQIEKQIFKKLAMQQLLHSQRL